MNDEQRFLADAYVDGELSDDDRRAAETDPAVMAEVAELRAMRAALRQTAAPSDDARERAIAAAMGVFAARSAEPVPATPAAATPASGAAATSVADSTPTGTGRRGRVATRRSWTSRLLPVAAGLVALGALGVLVNSLTSSDFDQSANDESTADEGDRAVDDAVPRDGDRFVERADAEGSEPVAEPAPSADMSADAAMSGDADMEADDMEADAMEADAMEAADTDEPAAEENAAEESTVDQADQPSADEVIDDWERLVGVSPLADLDPSVAGVSGADPIVDSEQLAEFAVELLLVTDRATDDAGSAALRERCAANGVDIGVEIGAGADAVIGPAYVAVDDTVRPAMVVIHGEPPRRQADAFDAATCAVVLSVELP